MKLEQNLQEMKLEMTRVEYPSYKKDGGVWPEEVQLEKCTEENELIKQWKVIAGQDIPDRERISVILKEIIDQGNRWEKVCKKESSRAQTVLEDKNRLLKEAELLNQLFDSYERVLSRLEEKMPEKAKYEFLTGRIQTGKKAGRVLQEEKRYLEEEKRLTELEVQERSLQKELQECRKQLQELTDKQKEAGREKTEKETVLTEKKVRIQDAILQYQGMNAKKKN